jgi:hypothetical protein
MHIHQEGTSLKVLRQRGSSGPGFSRILRLIMELHHGDIPALEAIAAGKPVSISLDAPVWAWLALRDLTDLIRSGLLYLRCCRQCRRWFTTKDPRRNLCVLPRCQRADAARRAKISRDHSQEQNRRASQEIKRSRAS